MSPDFLGFEQGALLVAPDPRSGRSCEPEGTLFEPRNRAKPPSKLIPLLLACYDEMAGAADLLAEREPTAQEVGGGRFKPKAAPVD